MFELYSVDSNLNDPSGRFYGIIIREKLGKHDDTLYYYIKAIYDIKFKEIHAVWMSDEEPDSIKLLTYKSLDGFNWICPVRASYDKSVYEFKKVYMKDKEAYDKKLEKLIIDSMI